ncbi:hypothetical protein Z945_1682 [Sulfitobacter noctilucae]|nr:hypothetical protein Z945_1682 [Sulfitobacter noctilucae]
MRETANCLEDGTTIRQAEINQGRVRDLLVLVRPAAFPPTKKKKGRVLKRALFSH